MAEDAKPPRPYTVGQVVAANFIKARTLHGWSQAETAKKLAPYVGALWESGNVASLERSKNTGHRRFDVDDLVAFAECFDLPLAWFFLPPEDASIVQIADPDRKGGRANRPVVQEPLHPDQLIARLFPDVIDPHDPQPTDQTGWLAFWDRVTQLRPQLGTVFRNARRKAGSILLEGEVTAFREELRDLAARATAIADGAYVTTHEEEETL